jgi:hypothetical protein
MSSLCGWSRVKLDESVITTSIRVKCVRFILNHLKPTESLFVSNAPTFLKQHFVLKVSRFCPFASLVRLTCRGTRSITSEIGFISRLTHIRLMVGKAALGQVTLRILFPPISIIPPVLHTHLHLHVTLIWRTKGRSLETCQKAMFFRKTGSFG